MLVYTLKGCACAAEKDRLKRIAATKRNDAKFISRGSALTMLKIIKKAGPRTGQPL
jgi:hypothetical protein